MHLVIVSHKNCWESAGSPSGYATDGGFPLQVRALSELFSRTTLVVPCEKAKSAEEDGITPLHGNNLRVVPLSSVDGWGAGRKLAILKWSLRNGAQIWRSVKRSDVVHTPIPSDVATIGMVFALILRKRLFVRHCGNWMKPRTIAEHIWKRGMELFAGPRNVMFATGGDLEPPSPRNRNIDWIFSTSLTQCQIQDAKPRTLTAGKLKLVVACRQERKKGTDVVIKSIPLILKSFPEATLDVVGGGSLNETFKKLSVASGVADRIVFHGKVSQSTVLDLLKQCDVFCFPTSASEGFPKVVVEALTSGLPVVTTKVSVLPQLVGNGCGVLVDDPTPEAVAAAVKKICIDPQKYSEMSENAIRTARQFTLEKWRDRIGKTLTDTWQVDLTGRATKVLHPQEQA